jgi:hypothetical protein
VERTGYQLLAGPVLPGDENPRRGGTDLCHQLTHPRQRFAGTHHLVPVLRRFPKPRILPRQLGVGQRVPYREQQAVGVQRLLQEVEGAALGGLDGGGDGAVTGDHDDLGPGVEVPQPGEGLQPVEPGHLHIEEDQMGPELGVEGDRLPP